MSWTIAVEHVTEYRYTEPAQVSYNEIRMTPQENGEQLVLETGLEISPPVNLFPYRDYWDTMVQRFDIRHPHDRLRIVARSVVKTPAGHEVPAVVSPKWDEDEFAEQLAPTALTALPADKRVQAMISELIASNTPASAVAKAAKFVNRSLRYQPGSTAVSTTAAETWQIKKGVCQDFSHLCIALLRAAGIPARYVSGYYYPLAEGEIEQEVAGESHAWVEAWVGWWMQIDPTNLNFDPKRYIVIGHGRDYNDVAPFVGIYSGSGESEMTVNVILKRLA